MESNDDAIRHDELLAQLSWVRALARSLVADPEVADDVLQQVCLMALQQAPRDARAGPRLRAWLATVTRNLVRNSARADRRRVRREQAVAQPESLASTDNIAARREALRSLMDAVTSLEEPYFSVVVERYFDGLSVADIAKRHGASMPAVRQQLSRARQKLRARLESLLADDRRGWISAALGLTPVAASLKSAPARSLFAHLGGLLVTKSVSTLSTAICVGLVLVACLLIGTWYGAHETRQEFGQSSVVTAPGAIPESVDAPPLVKGAVSAASPEPARAIAPLGNDGTTRRISGQVGCLQGGALVGAIVRVLPATAAPTPAELAPAPAAADAPVPTDTPGPAGATAPLSAREAAFAGVLTDSTGRFALTDVPLACHIVECFLPDDPGYRVTQEITIPAGDVSSCYFLFDPGITVFGTVTGLDDKPGAGATIGVDDAPRGTADAKGSYALHHVRSEKRERGETCYAEADGYVRETKPLEFPSGCNGQVQVNFRIGLGGSIVGTVTDTDALPVAGVDVRIEADMADLAGREAPKHLTTTTSDDGSYRLSGVPSGRYIVQVGMPQWEGRFRGPEAWESTGTLRIRTKAGPATEYSDTGEAWRGLASRWIGDVNVAYGHEPTHLDVVLDAGATVEGHVTDETGRIAPGASLIVQRLWRWPQTHRATSHASESWVQIFITRGDGATPGEVLRSTALFAANADANGFYRIEHVPAGEMLLLSTADAKGKSPQSRLVRIAGPEHLTGIDCKVGPGVTLSGRVLDTDGRPVPKAYLYAWPMGSPYFERTSSNAEGWFEIPGLPPSAVLLKVEHEAYKRFGEQLVPDDASHEIVLEPRR